MDSHFRSSAGKLNLPPNGSDTAPMPHNLESIRCRSPAEERSVPDNPSQKADSSKGEAASDAEVLCAKSARLSVEKETCLAIAIEKKKRSPLQLLDLPMDILKVIVKEVTHTNDLTSLALTHSALHNLVIPQIYSRFDIVWPDSHNAAEPRNGVDALTYGLATLVMREDLFDIALGCNTGSCHDSSDSHLCNHCGMVNYKSNTSLHPTRAKRRIRRGNFFSQFTRKFSLGNGPVDWVQEYLITKEGGKMLGTLIALTIARMPNLETFVWDMPTGILRDIWIALSSLADYGNRDFRNGEDSRLETLWIRLHDNRDLMTQSGPVPPVSATQPASTSLGTTANPPPPLQTDASSTEVPISTLLEWSYQHIEHPSFSIISPLKRLCVLNIDELAYLAEIGVLIERSLRRLRELRIGIAATAYRSGWAATASYPGLSVSTAGDDKTELNNTGGVLELLMARIYDCHAHGHSPSAGQSGSHVATDTLQGDIPVPKSSPSEDLGISLAVSTPLPSSPAERNVESDSAYILSKGIHGSHDALSEQRELGKSSPNPNPLSSPMEILSPKPPPSGDSAIQHGQLSLREVRANNTNSGAVQDVLPTKAVPAMRRMLTLELLELERVHINVLVLQKTIDWTMITSLTFLHCNNHEELWKAFKRTYYPRSRSTRLVTSLRSTSKGTPQHTSSSQEYRLNLKRIHTDTVSPALVSFLKDTLAPNSLEWMFLQEENGPDLEFLPKYVSPVTIDTIYRGPLRRHRASLEKVLIDSAVGISRNRIRNQKWRKWMLNLEVLSFVTSGKMSRLKELAMAIDYKNWHFFLQRLPQIPRLRSLHVPYIADYVHAHRLDARELALQVVDIVALRPEIEICYLGISTKCFEILENRSHDDSSFPDHESATSFANAGPGGGDETHEDSDADEYDDEDEDDDNNDEDNDTNETAALDVDTDGSNTDASNGDSDGSASGDSATGKKRPKLKLREILFYDDKISIFKARHARL